MLIDNLCQKKAFDIVDNLIHAGVYIGPIIADHAETNLSALPYIVVADLSNGNREPVAHALGDFFYYTALLFQGKNAMESKTQAAHADNHDLQLPLQLFNDKRLNDVAFLKILK